MSLARDSSSSSAAIYESASVLVGEQTHIYSKAPSRRNFSGRNRGWNFPLVSPPLLESWGGGCRDFHPLIRNLRRSRVEGGQVIRVCQLGYAFGPFLPSLALPTSFPYPLLVSGLVRVGVWARDGIGIHYYCYYFYCLRVFGIECYRCFYQIGTFSCSLQ